MPLYSFGSNGNFQLSLSHDEDVSIPTLCLFSSSLISPPSAPPQSIIAGGNHTFLLYPSGEVYAAGLNSSGQCGLHPDSAGKKIRSFSKLPSPEENTTPLNPIATQWGFCTAGWEFSILATKDGKRVYSCGSGTKGELGLGPSILTTIQNEFPSIPESTLCQIPNFPPEDTYVTYLTSSITHIIAVLNTGAVWGWGQSRKLQLHYDRPLDSPTLLKTATATPVPRIISGIPFPVARAACTQECTFLISMTGDKQVLLGPQSPKWGLRDQRYLQTDKLIGYTTVQATWNGFYILKENGKIHAWGRGDKRQLPPDELTNVKMMAVGSEHVIAVIEKGGGEKLVAWGWGEHGNCGELEQGQRDVVALREIQIAGTEGREGKIICIGAGCATSWVWVDWE